MIKLIIKKKLKQRKEENKHYGNKNEKQKKLINNQFLKRCQSKKQMQKAYLRDFKQ